MTLNSLEALHCYGIRLQRTLAQLRFGLDARLYVYQLLQALGDSMVKSCLASSSESKTEGHQDPIQLVTVRTDSS